MACPPVDIVISTYRGAARIEPAIVSILSEASPTLTLWVLDQSEDDAVERLLAPYAAADGRLRYIRMPVRGIAATRNAGAAMGEADFILFTNDDCVVEPGWAAALAGELEASGAELAFGRTLPGVEGPAAEGQVLATKISTLRQVYRGNRFDLGFGQGHNMAVRRAAFAALGGFDPLLGQGGELGAWDERDLGYRALRAGMTIIYTPDAVVRHCHWQRWAEIERRFRDYGIGNGAAVAKYLRQGDAAALLLLLEWQLSQGLRQMASGLLKSRSPGKMRIGALQLYYPLLGLARGLRHDFSRSPDPAGEIPRDGPAPAR